MNFLPKQIHLLISLTCLIVFSAMIASCGRKGPPLPQKMSQLYSFQDVYVHQNPLGTLTIEGVINGARENVQALVLEIEGYDESCLTCPFVPAESFNIEFRETWNNTVPREFSFTVMPTKLFEQYRWRLIGHNNISGLPNVVTPVLKVQVPIEDSRPFVEIPMNVKTE